MITIYREHAPARLADFVDCFWTIRGSGLPDTPRWRNRSAGRHMRRSASGL
jgi:hypothetical protein